MKSCSYEAFRSVYNKGVYHVPIRLSKVCMIIKKIVFRTPLAFLEIVWIIIKVCIQNTEMCIIIKVCIQNTEVCIIIKVCIQNTEVCIIIKVCIQNTEVCIIIKVCIQNTEVCISNKHVCSELPHTFLTSSNVALRRSKKP